MMKQDIKEKEKKLIEMTTNFCSKELNEEYSNLCQDLIRKMGRKKEIPFKRGQLDIWAASIVYAIGSVNFLFDKSFEPYMAAKQISKIFGTKNSTVSNKARKIRKMFDMVPFDPEFSTQNMKDSNPINDLVMVDGYIVHISVLPEDLQQKVRSARANGKDIEFYTE